jgi:hypothetical protein
MPQSQAASIRLLAFLDESQCGKQHMLGLAPHDQMQHDRHGD